MYESKNASNVGKSQEKNQILSILCSWFRACKLIGLIAILLTEKDGATDWGRGGVREFHLAFFRNKSLFP